MPQPITTLSKESCRALTGILCDIDDTLTTEGRLEASAYQALWDARESGLRVIPVTGRPAGWVDQIARLWPVAGVVGENGGLWFFMGEEKLERRFLQNPAERAHNRKRLMELKDVILNAVPGSALASDQPYRELDLAIDFCEDVPPLTEQSIQEIVRRFTLAGATCKVSSIHVNGWFGRFNKWDGCARLVRELYGEDLTQTTASWAYFGDSANDEPMFAQFEHSIGVANVAAFLPQMDAHPTYICQFDGGRGFAEGIDHILSARAEK